MSTANNIADNIANNAANNTANTANSTAGSTVRNPTGNAVRNLPPPHMSSSHTPGPHTPSPQLPNPRAATTSLAARIDNLDALIWAAARATDDPQQAVGRARDYSETVFVGLVVGAGSGTHRLNCSVPTPSGPVTAGEDLRFEIADDVRTVSLPASGAEREVCELFALAHVSGAEATAILRTRPLSASVDFGTTFDLGRGLSHGGSAPEGYVVRGWRLAGGETAPIDAAGMFAFCCSEASSGEPLPLDPNTRYADARALVTPPRPG